MPSVLPLAGFRFRRFRGEDFRCFEIVVQQAVQRRSEWWVWRWADGRGAAGGPEAVRMVLEVQRPSEVPTVGRYHATLGRLILIELSKQPVRFFKMIINNSFVLRVVGCAAYDLHRAWFAL